MFWPASTWYTISFLELSRFTVAHHSWVKSLHSDPSLHFHLIPSENFWTKYRSQVAVQSGHSHPGILDFLRFISCLHSERRTTLWDFFIFP